MHALRRSRRLATFVLAWFALWLTATLATPVMGGADLQLVCSGGSYKLVSGGKDAPTPSSGHLAQCPACVQLGAPPPATYALQLPSQAPAAQPATRDVAPATRDAAAPPGARGPPLFS